MSNPNDPAESGKLPRGSVEQLLLAHMRGMSEANPLLPALRDWHRRFRLGRITDPNEAQCLLDQVTGSNWTPEEEIKRLRRELAIEQAKGKP